MKILLTGGAGFIGSHTCIELIKAGHEVLIYDNLSNSSSKVLDRLERITNSEIKFIQNDIQNLLYKNCLNIQRIITYNTSERGQISIKYTRHTNYNDCI